MKSFNEFVSISEGSMATANKNVGASKCWKGYKRAGTKKKGGKTVPNCVKEHHQTDKDGKVIEHGDGTPSSVEEDITEGKKKGLWDNIHAKRKRGESPAKKGDKDYPKTLNVESKTAAWQRKEGKNKKGGLNEKGRKSYERENPGSDLKAPQPEGGSRKKSFCARMGGMKKKLTSSKTANDPDSRINKALRKWKCNEEDKAYNFVVNKLKAKYGSGVMTKGDKMPEPSAAQKKKNAAIRAKRAKEDHRDSTEKASDGRYSDRYSNRGSD